MKNTLITSLDIVYVNYNSSDCLSASVETVLKFRRDYHLNVVVIDNASEDNPHRIKDAHPEIIFIQNINNIGFGAAINQALPYCKSDFIIFLNPDSFISNEFFKSSINFMMHDMRVGIMGPMILDEDGSVQGSARAFPTPLTSLFGRNSPITKLFPNNSITAKNILTAKNGIKSPAIVDWISGACMVVRKDAILSVGGFDKRFFLYWEDADLCRRIKQAGWKVVYFPECKVIHKVGVSSNTRPVFANYQFHKSCYRLYEKYAEWPFSAITPIAGIALMLRFLVAIFFNWINRAINRIRKVQEKKNSEKNKKQNKIRIFRVISRMNIGGPSIHVKNLVEYLDSNKFESRLITGKVSSSEGDMGYIVKFKKKIRISIPELQREINIYKDFIALIKILSEIIRFQPHLLHSHTSKAGTISRLAVFFYNIFKKNKIVVIHTFHGNVLDGYFDRFKSLLFLWIEKLLAFVTDRIIAISESQKWELSTAYKICNPQKIETVKLGFDLKPFLNTTIYKGVIRKRLGISEETLLVGIVGRMVPIKNHKMFIDSASLFLKNHSDIKIKFLLVGDGELRSSLEDYVAATSFTDHIIFYGWEKNIPIVYANLDILALTSLNEGTPVSIIEAMAAKVPVVTTGVGGIKDLLGHIDAEQPYRKTFKICQRGILCPKDDPYTFYSALNYMINSGYLSDIERFSKAQDYVARNYSVDRLINDIESLYERLIIEKQGIKTQPKIQYAR